MEGHSHSHGHRHMHRRGHHVSSRISTLPTNEVVNLVERANAIERMPSANTFSSLFRRANCDDGDTSSACEKPVGGTNITLIITLAVCIPIFFAFLVLIYLHRRTKKLQAKEDQDDRYKSMDFGMGETSTKGNKRKSKLFGGEKETGHTKGLSMDMNLSSPYLLPSGPQQSRESLHSLARTLQNQEDPYRHVDSYLGSDAASMRSFPKGADGRASVFTARTNMSGRDSPRIAPRNNLPPRQGSIPTAPLPQIPVSVKEIGREEANETPPPQYAPPSKNGFNFTNDVTASPQVGGEHVTMPAMPEIKEPAPVAKPVGQKETQVTERPVSYESIKVAQPFVGGFAGDRDSAALPASDLYHGNAGGLGIMGSQIPQTVAEPAPIDTTPVSLRPGRKDSAPVVSEVPSEYSDYASYGKYEYPEEDDRGRRASRVPAEQEPAHPTALAVPNKDNKRLSVGFRPLPPADYLESEDPEFRANRIRSFYKEYFDDGSEPRPPMPQPQKAQYYEDYDANYAGGDAAYYDPASNAFVMPYAEPVTRRAMTPPPSNRRPMPGPRHGGPRGPPGPRGPGMGPPGPRPRAGSTMSGGRFGPMSPRPGSSASARMGGRPGPKKPIAPPQALSTLPTASKVQDEHFMILNPIDFAPPPTWKDQAAGRSQSPMGERRAYNLSVPVSSPLVSSFDDTPTLPSPHLLRKSGTFNALDFAPPKRFKDPDSMSDAGSVRSMGSGISAMQNKAIRDGAGRVSRLPEDQVFTQAAMGNVLKPNWGMRD